MAPFQPDDYRLLADSIPQIIYSALPDGRVEYYNRAWYAYTGQTPDEALEDGWSSVVHPDDLVRTGERWQEAMRTGEPHHVEFRLRHTDGHYRWFVGRGEPVRDAEGAVVRWYGGCMDIHDLKVAESTIRDHASRFRRLANALPQIVWTSDANGKNTFLNHRWFDYTGVDPRRPHSLAAVTHPDDYPAAWAAWQRSLATGAGYEIEYRLRRVDGVYRWFLGRAVATRAPDDSILEWFGSCTDIEDQKRAEENVRRAFEREHAIATTLQRAFLTHRMPAIDGFRFDAVYRPAEREAEVGGDWYDVIELDDGRIVVSIGDVAGHGLGSAVIMGNVRQAIRAVANVAGPDPAAMLDVADRCLRRESPDTIVTAFVGIIDPASREMAFATAGHPPPLVVASNEVVELVNRGLPLGLRRTGEVGSTSVLLPDDGTLVLYTDGLIESTRDLEEGERRLREALVAADLARVRDTAAFIENRVLTAGARDDVAILAVTIGTREGARLGLREQVA
jgi:PAS domain S-box-containing protein